MESITPGSGATLFSAAGPKIYGWDPVVPTAPLFCHSPHQKTITTLAYDRKTMSLLSGSIDHHVKVTGINPTTGEPRTERTFVYGSPVLSIAIQVRGFLKLTSNRIVEIGLL